MQDSPTLEISHDRLGRSALRLLGIIALMTCSSVFSLTQSSPAPKQDPETQTGRQVQDASSETHPNQTAPPSSRGAFVAVPVPMSSPAIGSGVVLMLGYITPLSKNDSLSPPSIFGVVGLYTDNASRGLGGGAELYFKQDRYHVVAGYAQARLNYEFYGTGTAAGNSGRKFGLKQDVDTFFAQATRRIGWGVCAGPRVLWGTTTLAPQNLSERFPNLPPLNVSFDLRSLGIKAERDTRTNRFYPTQGSSTQFSSDFFDSRWGSAFTFQTYRATFSAYQALSPKQVLAYNVYACMTGGRAPFFGQCIFGTDSELRGYVAGRYIDRDMAAAQMEYRLSMPKRLGVVLFAGVGEVGPAFGEFNYSNQLPSIGVGPRFQLSTKYHVNLRADFAQGKNERTFSMGLGEAF